MATSLIDIAAVRDLVGSPLSDAALQVVIDREDQAIVDRFGAHYEGTTVTVVETLRGEDGPNLYLRRAATSMDTLEEKATFTGDWEELTADEQYYLWAGEGRVERLSGSWGVLIRATYVPADDNEARRTALIELVRIAVERTGMKAESIAGEYSYQASDWEADRAAVFRRLGFMEV